MEKFDNRIKDSVGSSRIRGRWVYQNWEEAEEFRIGEAYDAIVYQKVYWKEMMKNFNGLQILDICDPDWLESKPVFEYVDMVDGVVTSSPTLAEYMKRIRPGKKIVCIPDRIDFSENQLKKEKHTGRAKTVAWFGYSHNIHYLFKTFDFLIQRGLELVVISNEPFNPPLGFKNLQVRNIPYSYPDVNRHLIDCDMVLLPVPDDDARGKFKSNNKTVQAWSLGLPVVTSSHDLDIFMDGEARQKEADEKRAFVLQEYDVKKSVEEYKLFFNELTVDRHTHSE